MKTTPGKSAEKYSWKIAPDVVDEVRSFYCTSKICQTCTSALEDIWGWPLVKCMIKIHWEICFQKGQLPIVHLENWNQMMLSNDVVTIDKTPNRQCCCDNCKNFRIVILAMKQSGFKSLGANSKACIEDSLCKLSQLPNSDAYPPLQWSAVDGSTGGTCSLLGSRDPPHFY